MIGAPHTLHHAERLQTSPLLRAAAGAVQRRTHTLAGRLIEARAVPNAAAGHWKIHQVAADLNVWTASLTGEIARPDIERRFEERGREHAGRGVPLKDAILAQYAVFRLLRETVCAVVTEYAVDHEETEAGAQRFFDDFTTDLLLVATAGIAAGYQAVHARPPGTRYATEALAGQERRLEQPTALSRLPAQQTIPLSWCLVTVARPDADMLAGRLRTVNPRTLVSVVERRVLCLSPRHPRVPENFPPYGITQVEDDIVRAARHGELAADMALRYGLDHVDARQVLPLIGTLEWETERREEYLSACLGSLHTSERHRHLMDTLSVYLSHGLRTASAARSLYVHRHTLTYRLRSIHSLTGLDLDHPLHRLRAELALLLLPVREEADP